MSISPTARSAQDAARRTNGEFGTQTHGDPGIVNPSLSANARYIRIARRGERDRYTGPYADEETANEAIASTYSGAREEVVTFDALPAGVADRAAALPDLSRRALWTDDEAATVTPDQIADAIPQAGSFEGYWGEDFRQEVTQVVYAIQQLEGRVEAPIVFTPDEEFSSDQFGFSWRGYQITKVIPTFEDLSTNHDATGRDAALAIAEAVIAKRDTMFAEFKADAAG